MSSKYFRNMQSLELQCKCSHCSFPIHCMFWSSLPGKCMVYCPRNSSAGMFLFRSLYLKTHSCKHCTKRFRIPLPRSNISLHQYSSCRKYQGNHNPGRRTLCLKCCLRSTTGVLKHCTRHKCRFRSLLQCSQDPCSRSAHRRHCRYYLCTMFQL